ncbi:MAG TPA: hypothetical protein VLE97_01855 [Gaiellaceae bacterium]|nr:hypothetical protein [Gaiellaceae bacterium]
MYNQNRLELDGVSAQHREMLLSSMKHINDLFTNHRDLVRRSLDDFKYERLPDGKVFVPSVGTTFGGIFMHDVNGKDRAIDANVMLFAGLSDILRVYFAQSSPRTAFYLAPFSNAIDPAQTLTAATFDATMAEFVNYTQSARPTWAKDAEAGQQIGNVTTPCQFTIGSGGGTIWGAGITTSSGKGVSTGLMPACARFAAVRNLVETDVLNLSYIFTALDATPP